MVYRENPKTKGSGIVCCIPQRGECPIKCPDCFFQSGRSYLEPLKENLPNIPIELAPHQILRVNDGNDSNVDRVRVIQATNKFAGRRFFNTSRLKPFHEPWVLTVNPGNQTDTWYAQADSEYFNMNSSLMFVRFRVNTWNLELADSCVRHYAGKLQIPVVLTFMAYFQESVKEGHEENYEYRKRTLNSYWVIKFDVWKKVMARYGDNPLVHSCSGPNNFACKNCGTCLREFYRVKEAMIQ